MDRLNSAGADLAFQSSTDASDITASRNAGQGESLASQTLPTPLRSGRNE